MLCHSLPGYESRSYSPDNIVPEVILFIVKMFKGWEQMSLRECLCSSVSCLGLCLIQPLWNPWLLRTAKFACPWLTLSFCAFSGIVTLLFLRTMALASSSFSWLVDVGTHPKCSACHVQCLLNISFHSYKHLSKQEQCPYWAHKHVWISAPCTFSAYKSHPRSLFFLGKNKKRHSHVPCSITAHILRARLRPYVLICLRTRYSVGKSESFTSCQWLPGKEKGCRDFLKMPRTGTDMWVRVKFMFTCSYTLDMSPHMVMLFVGCLDWSLYYWLP